MTLTNLGIKIGSLDGHSETGHDAEAGHHVPEDEGENAARQDPCYREECVWSASFILSDIRGLMGWGGKNKSPFLHDLAIQRNCLWMAVTETCLTNGVLDI